MVVFPIPRNLQYICDRAFQEPCAVGEEDKRDKPATLQAFNISGPVISAELIFKTIVMSDGPKYFREPCGKEEEIYWTSDQP